MFNVGSILCTIDWCPSCRGWPARHMAPRRRAGRCLGQTIQYVAVEGFRYRPVFVGLTKGFAKKLVLMGPGVIGPAAYRSTCW